MNQDTILNIGKSLAFYNPGEAKGFFVSSNLIATAAHCLRARPPHNIEVHLRNGEKTTGSIVHCDFAKDIGLIRTSSEHHKPLEMCGSPLSMGCKIARAGLLNQRSENGFAFDLEYGIFERMVPSPGNPQWKNWTTEMLCLRLSSNQGFSGSPILYDGKVCGILVAGNSLGEIFAVPSKYIEELL